MRILFVAAEASPLVKVGGLADVIGSLPNALAGLGHEVRLMMPQYGAIDVNQYPLVTVRERFDVPVGGGTEPASLRLDNLKKVFAYLVGNDGYFGGEQVYGGDDLNRFLFFSRAAFSIVGHLGWKPDVIHCHDWHTALLPMWLKKRRAPYATVFTIHNLAYQGRFDDDYLNASGLSQDWKDLNAGAPPPPYCFLGQGITWADLVTTVSETYAKEILNPEYGEGLDHLLRYRQKDLVGIVNGIDYEEYNPEKDPYIPARFSASTIARRAGNKLALQKQFNLPPDAQTPLIGMVQRLDDQKGIDILVEAIDTVLQEKAQLVIVGRGREHYEASLTEIAGRFPEQMGLFTGFDEAVARLAYAGCDIFLMPSRYEPCGLGQMIAMRYGAVPVVRHTGGLADTVPELSPDLGKGNGFVFKEYTPEAMIGAVKRSLETYRNRKAWTRVMERLMKQDFSWQNSAKKYEAAYKRVVDFPKLLTRQ